MYVCNLIFLPRRASRISQTDIVRVKNQWPLLLLRESVSQAVVDGGGRRQRRRRERTKGWHGWTNCGRNENYLGQSRKSLYCSPDSYQLHLLVVGFSLGQFHPWAHEVVLPCSPCFSAVYGPLLLLLLPHTKRPPFVVPRSSHNSSTLSE